MKNKEDIKFQIDQLRKDKMIYALESIAAFMAVMMFSSFVGAIFPGDITAYFVAAGYVGTLVYWFFVVVGNLNRLKKIRDLENQL